MAGQDSRAARVPAAASEAPWQKLTGRTLDERWYALWFGFQYSQWYYSERLRHFTRLHRVAQAAGLVASSATFLAVFGEWQESVRVQLAALAALVALVSLIWGFANSARESQDLTHAYGLLLVKHANQEPTEANYAALLGERLTLEAKEPPPHFALAEMADNAIRRRLGHEVTPLPWYKSLTAHWLAWRPRGPESCPNTTARPGGMNVAP